MNRRILLLSLLVSIWSGILAQEPVNKLIPGQWFNSWLICGPIPLQEHISPEQTLQHYPGFENDYLVKSGGEANLKVKAGDAVRLKGKTLRWKYINTPDSVIDLVANVSRISPTAAYAYSAVDCPEEGVWLAALGTNDGGSLWINGVREWDYQPPRGVKPDSDLIPVILKKGKNTILLKVEQRGNMWGFCFRFHEFSAAEALQRGSFFKINTAAEGDSRLVSDFSPEVLSRLLKQVRVTVRDKQGKVVLDEKREKEFNGSLDLPEGDYRPLIAELSLQLRSGEMLSREIEFVSGKRVEYSLFKNRRSDYHIVLSPGASASEKWAAEELQHWLKDAGGADLPIVEPDKTKAAPNIVIGYPGSSIVGEKEPDINDESFRYFNSGNNIYIYGGRQRGTMYGVFSFLERELGCRWYTPRVSVIPKRNEFTFSWLDHTEKPGVRVRNDFYYEAFEPVWAARNRVNGAMSYRKQPGGVEAYWAVHTFFPLMPPDEFYKKHPEYYSLIDGKRIFERAQLCLSNPNVLRIITERIKERMRESPEYLIYDVSQNDWTNPCQCDNCQAIVKRYGGESGIIIWFVNQVADAVAQEFPDKFIGTLAYQYTRSAPRDIVPRNNVVVRLCSIECCVAHDFHCSANQSFLTDLEEWSSISPHLYIWDYVVNFNHYLLPLPNFATLQSKINTFQQNKAIGIMEQAAYQSRGGEFAELRSYLISKILWNLDANTDEVVNDFLSGYYGRAGSVIRRYFDLLQSLVKPDVHFPYGIKPDDEIYSEDFIKRAEYIFAEAESVADNEEILQRVELAGLPILYLKCMQSPVTSRYDGTYAKFSRISEREGITHYNEEGESYRKAFHQEMKTAGH
ncbi:MAG: DUF4838 domain-containing protein [Chitinophagaceae bacterium]|nr:DUF4838 domain-containing protein [Chitinophagaceae bacterium]